MTKDYSNNIIVRHIRDMTGLTQEDYCKQFGLSVSTFRSWEQDRRKCPDSIVFMLRKKTMEELDNE